MICYYEEKPSRPSGSLELVLCSLSFQKFHTMMPVKLYLNGYSVGYNLSQYQQLSKTPKNEKRRFYGIDNSQKNRLISSAMIAASELKRGNALCFATFTYQFNESFGYNPYYNDHITAFFKDASRHLQCSGYIWTKELTKKEVIHYHAIFELENIRQWKDTDIPISKRLNDLWCRHRGYYSPNAMTIDKKHGLIIKNPVKAANYAAKYAGKSHGQKYPTPAYRLSNRWQYQPLTIREEQEEYLQAVVDQQIANTYFKSDFAECWQIPTEKSILLHKLIKK